jgi:hypothetical protein
MKMRFGASMAPTVIGSNKLGIEIFRLVGVEHSALHMGVDQSTFHGKPAICFDIPCEQFATTPTIYSALRQRQRWWVRWISEMMRLGRYPFQQAA